MGAWIDLYIGGREKAGLSASEIDALAFDLLAQEAVTGPYAIVTSANISALTSPISVEHMVESGGKNDLEVVWQGTCTKAFLQNLDGVLAQRKDFCLHFGWVGDEVLAELEEEGWPGGGTLLLYSFSEPREVAIFNAYEGDKIVRTYATYAVLTANKGPKSVENTQLEDILTQHFGPLQEDVAAS